MFMSIINSVLAEASIAPLVANYNSFVASLGDFYAFALIALCLLVGLFGRRCSGLIRVVLLFAIGFVASVHWVAPFISGYIPGIPALYVGLTVGFIAAILSRMIYNGVYIGCIGFDVYNICFNALFFVELTGFTKGNLTYSLVAAGVAIVIALLVRKYLEMLITSAAGGIGAAFFLKWIFDYTVHFEYDPNMTMLVLGAILAVPMFLYQYRNRSFF